MPLLAGYLKVSLELQILIINFLGLVDSILNWSWHKWDQQLEKIWNLSVSQINEINAKDVDWIKTILSQIVVARFVISRLSFIAYFANIYTILTQNWQNLLILWMVLSFVKDIVLEAVVIVTTFLLWHKGCVATSIFIKFIVTKTIWLVVSVGKWYKTLKWYTQLRRVATFRRFTIIAQRNIASVRVSGRAGHSLDDECLDVAIIRRDRYASLLNLDELPEQSPGKVNSELRATKSLTTLIISASHGSDGTNDHDPLANDLSVGEKSMKMLNITAEDVMDARSRIQERSYWSEQSETAAKTANSTEEVLARFSLEKTGKELDDLSRKGQTARNDTTADLASRVEDVAKRPSTVKEKRDNDSRTIWIERKSDAPTKKETADLSSTRNGHLVSDEAKSYTKLMELCEYHTALTRREREKARKVQKATKIVQCPSSESARNMEAKPCSSLVRKMMAKLGSVPASRRDEWIERIDRERHPCRAKLLSINSGAGKKDCCKKYPRMYMCHCLSHANTDAERSDKRSSNDERIECKNEFDAGIGALKYSEYRAAKQTQMSRESSRKTPVVWNRHVPLAQTARLSEHEKRPVAANGLSTRRTNVQTETRDKESRDSLSAQHKLKHVVQHGRSIALGSMYNTASFRGGNYAESEERETIELRALRAYNDLTLLEDKRNAKERKRHELPSIRGLSAEEREAIELRALRAYNRLSLLEDKKELEARKKYDSSEEHEVPKMRAWKTYNDLTLLEDEGEVDDAITRYNLSSCERSIKKLEALAAYEKKLARSADESELEAGRKHSASPRRDDVEDVEVPSRPPSRSSATDDDSVIRAHETREASSENGGARLNDDRAGQAVRVSLNLREVTRNIEWTLHPRGIVLVNKSLLSPHSEEPRESLQRDIVDGDTASALHRALFFKPEIVTRIFQRARARIGESFSSLRSYWRQDLDTEFACRVNNETIVRDSLLDFDLERMLVNRSDSADDADETRVAADAMENDDRDVCVILIEREEISSESDTATVDDSTESREDARSSIENSRATSILVFGEAEHQHRTDNTTNDNLPIQLLIDMLRNLGVEIPERGISIERIEEEVNANDDETSRKSTRLSNGQPEDEGERACTRVKSDGGISQFQDVESSSLVATEARRENASGEEANESWYDRFSENSDGKLRGDDSFDSTYERDDDGAETPVSLEEGSLMEEFSRDTVPS